MNDVEKIGAAFTALISTTTGSPVTLRTAPRRMSGGFWASIWAVDLADGAPVPFNRPMVLRIMPERAAGLREAIVQKVVANAGFRTPRVMLSGVAEGLGEAYIVMERVNGRTPLSGLKLGPQLVALPKLLRRLPDMLAAAATELHAIDPSNLRTALKDARIEPRPTNNPFRSVIDNAVRECPRPASPSSLTGSIPTPHHSGRT
jgi:aminoglycoside phosphotransferase (APT) family kinase protein